MSIEHADQLQELLETQGRENWPLPHEQAISARISEWRAFRTSDAAYLKQRAQWDQGDYRGRRYIVDPLAERIPEAFADLIYGSEPLFEAPKREEPVDQPLAAPDETRDVDGPDQELLDDLVDENDLPSDLQEAVKMCVAEGEVYARIYVDRDAFEHPVIEWHSRLDTVPLFRGKKLLACAFISEVSSLAPDAPVQMVSDDADPTGTRWWAEGVRTVTQGDDTVYRYVEIQTGGLVRNLLFRGDRGKLGTRVPLTDLPQFADLRDEWPHNLEIQTRAGEAVPLMLAFRFTNGGHVTRVGRSQYAGVRDLLYELNRNASVGSRNVDLTMHKRITINEMYANPAAALDDDEGTSRTPRVQLPDAFLVGSNPDEMAEGKVPMGVLEFSDSWSTALIEWDLHTVRKVLTRARVAPQLVGIDMEGAESGPALERRLIDSLLAADGKARVWDSQVPLLVRACQMVDALPEEQGGCGHDWDSPDEPPEVKRGSALPDDEEAAAIRVAALRGAEVISRRTAIKLALHVDDDGARDEEALLDAEGANAQAQQQPLGGGLPTAGANGVRVPTPAVNLDANGGNGAAGATPTGEGEVRVLRRNGNFEVTGLAGP